MLSTIGSEDVRVSPVNVWPVIIACSAIAEAGALYVVRALLCSFKQCVIDYLVWATYVAVQPPQGIMWTTPVVVLGGAWSFKLFHRVW